MNGQLDNALMAQKDHIINLIDSDRFDEAIILIDFSANLWASCSYDYKTREMKERLRGALRRKQEVCAHWKQHEKWKRILDSIR